MKGGQCLFLALLALSSAVALEMQINNQSLQQNYSFRAAQDIIFSFFAENGTTLITLQVQSDNAILEQALSVALSEVQLTTVYSDAYTETFSIPQELPSVSGAVAIKIRYLTPDRESKLYEAEFDLDIKSSDNASFWIQSAEGLPEDAQLVLFNYFTDYQIPRIDTELQYWELDADDTQRLGYEPRVYTNLANAYKNGDSSVLAQLPVITKTSSSETPAAAVPEYAAEGKQKPRVVIVKNTFSVTKGDKSITKSKVLVSVYADGKFLPSGEVIISVPKEIAQSADLLSPSEFPETLQDDPVLKWSMKNVPQNQVKDYSYTVDGDVQNFDTLAEAAADNPGLIARILLLFFGGKK